MEFCILNAAGMKIESSNKMPSDKVLQTVFVIFWVSAQSRGSHADSARSCLKPLAVGVPGTGRETTDL